MKQTLEKLLEQSVIGLQEAGKLPSELKPAIKLDRTKDKVFGDYASNLAMVLAKPAGMAPRALAEQLIQFLPKHPGVKRVEIAGAGFINFFIEEQALSQIIAEVLQRGASFGHSSLGQGQKVLIEFVSANPTGPLHVGHGRGAAFGATLANLLKTAGFAVSSEYYVNDAGRQMNILAVSLWLRYLQLAGEAVVFPANGYKGDYVLDMAKAMLEQQGKTFVCAWSDVAADLPADEPLGGDKEIFIDAMITKAKSLLGEEGFAIFHREALNAVLADIQDDLQGFGVHFDQWFSEQSLVTDGSLKKGIEALQKTGYCYEQDGALWFRSTAFGDEKDRVLVRANGISTYFASDVAYHWNKYDRGFTRVVDIFGADHHGYFARVKAAMEALGHDEEALKVLYVQFAILYRGNERVQMSTRSGSFVTLRELREDVGNDAARFFYSSRKPEQHMDFDLDLARSQSNDNPVYYIQYAHARICSVFRQMQERGLDYRQEEGLTHLQSLTEPQEELLITLISRYPEMIETAAAHCEPHQISYYLRELANGLHSYYNAVTLLCEDPALRAARLSLLQAVRQVLWNGLRVLGVSAPEMM